MKLTETKTLIAALAALSFVGAASAAPMLTDFDLNPVTGTPNPTSTATGLTALVSVASGTEGYNSGTANGRNDATSGSSTINTGFNGAVYDWGFYEGGGGIHAASVGSKGLVGALTNAGTGNAYVDVWTTSDHNSQAADYTGLGTRAVASDDVDGPTTGTIDISGLASGSIYIFQGRGTAWSTSWLNLTMSGAGQTDVVLNNAGTTEDDTSTAIWAARIDFADAALYDTITYSHYANLPKLGGGISAGYLAGVVVTDATEVPEPGSLALMGLGGLCVLRRRRS